MDKRQELIHDYADKIGPIGNPDRLEWMAQANTIYECMGEYADERVKDVLQWLVLNDMVREVYMDNGEYVYNEYKRSKGEY